ncbi:MAG: arginase [Candidatus Magasanikbacteria bacterium RIFCSPLOWO2_02_FULL_44_11]|uniref:Arginase n=1 Tax=Candidatus Magasanikbacteria bacterium RIFCSPLOWO2_02_FULL_44_11 TaxID=1798689 RepID=A0A1F6N977_9BACT|nr:MAG: arginase [Candidatus Magasanikbacteria bacterium RIFCSPLOWO2_02_FULL_44_11]
MAQDNLSFLEKKQQLTRASLIGIPLDLGKDNIGTDAGPKKLRELGIVKSLTSAGVDVLDRGDVPAATRAATDIGDVRLKYLEAILETLRPAAALIEKEIRQGQIPIAIGGDHSIAVGTISGASAACDGDLGIIWIDAHGDINTHETSLSGNIHGMPLAAVLGLGHPDLVNLHQPGQKIKSANVVYVGLKDLDQAEIDFIRQGNISAFTVMDIVRAGLEPVCQAIVALQKRVKKIWVSLDVDSIDALYAPSTPMLNKGGLTYREISALTQYIGKVCSLIGFEIVEFAPDRDKNNLTGQLIIELAARLLGTEHTWYTDYMDEEAKKQIRRGTNLVDAVHKS